jgi:hypothetical protein
MKTIMNIPVTATALSKIQNFNIRSMKRLLMLSIALLYVLTGISQTIISDVSSDTTANASAILDLRSSTKGFLPSRMTASQRLAISNPAEGLLVYQTDGSTGYYFFNGSSWALIGNSDGVIPVSKTISDTLEKSERLIVASNDIALTLPDITSADNGLSICIKNAGTYTDLIIVMPGGAATIDGFAEGEKLYRWVSQTYIAFEGNWIIRDKINQLQNVFDVSPTSSWTSIEEVIGFLDLHMDGPSVVRLIGGEFPVSNTQVIDLPYPLTIQGIAFSSSSITAAAGLAGKPMFRCYSECYFKMLQFDGSTLSNYGTQQGEDAIRLEGADEYFELKDIYFQNFYRGVVISASAEVWMFEGDMYNCASAGVEIAAGTAAASVKISEFDFNECTKAINLLSGNGCLFSVQNCGFYNSGSGSVAINYIPATFASFSAIYATSNTWNSVGSFLNGFDFSRADGRDRNAYIQDNAGVPNQTPVCKINVVNNASSTNLYTAYNWYKANWSNTSVITTQFGISGNKFTYQAKNSRNLVAIITGDLSVDNANRTISIGLVKNGVSSTQYGETTLRVTDANRPFQFATVIYLQNVNQHDYFEVFCRSDNSNDVVKFLDVHIFVDTK